MKMKYTSRGSTMLKVDRLYRPFHLQKKYEDMDEERILCSLYQYKTGTLENAISRIINEAIMGHMNLYIDSTIMQMLALNEYLSQLFIKNLKSLLFNYLINYMMYNGIEVIEEESLEKINQIVEETTMKTDFESLLLRLEALKII